MWAGRTFLLRSLKLRATFTCCLPHEYYRFANTSYPATVRIFSARCQIPASKPCTCYVKSTTDHSTSRIPSGRIFSRMVATLLSELLPHLHSTAPRKEPNPTGCLQVSKKPTSSPPPSPALQFSKPSSGLTFDDPVTLLIGPEAETMLAHGRYLSRDSKFFTSELEKEH